MAERASFSEFVSAQDRVWPDVLSELGDGQKRSHWMWFVFPQLAALGRSGMAKRFGLSDLADARAYLDHPVLGPRLLDCVALLLKHRDKDPEQIMGHVDALKLRSSLTLFHRANPNEPRFLALLETLYGGQPCPLTESMLTKS